MKESLRKRKTCMWKPASKNDFKIGNKERTVVLTISDAPECWCGGALVRERRGTWRRKAPQKEFQNFMYKVFRRLNAPK